MLDPRLYRVAFVPVLLAVLVTAFSFSARPRPIGTTLAADAFDGTKAGQTLDELARDFPERTPGDAADEALAGVLAERLRGAGPYRVEVDRFGAETAAGERTLLNVVAVRPGAPGPGIVVVAHRDAVRRGARAELSGTAALLELARVAGDGRLQRTITFVSTSGGSSGGAGAKRVAEQLGERPDAVLVLGDMGSRVLRAPYTVSWSNGRGQAPVRLRRTVEAAVRQEAGREPGTGRALVQWARLAAPGTIGEQGAFGRAGHPAVLLSATSERPPPDGAAVTDQRLGQFGRAALLTLYALDTGPDIAAPPQTDLHVRNRVVPSWAIRLLVGTLLLPPLVVAVDGWARLRRRHEPVGPWSRWALATALPFAIAGAFVVLLGALGLLGGVPPGPVPGPALELGGTAIAGFAAAALAFALAWLVLRPVVLRATLSGGTPNAPGAGLGVLLVACAAAVLLWVHNPYAAALAVPAVHVWTWAIVPAPQVPRVVAASAAALAALPPALMLLSDLHGFGHDAVGSAWQWTLLVASGHVPPQVWLLWSVLWGCAVAVVHVVLRTPRRREPAGGVTVRGPMSYAGPGSLGGTESALRR